jgi:lysophospholipase L1-like esterase
MGKFVLTACLVFVVNAHAQTPPLGMRFIPVTPCRVVDTRVANGPFGGPKLVAGETREFDLPQGSCGTFYGSGPTIYSLNVTAVPDGPLDYLTIWPAGQTQPVVSTLNSDGRVKANAAIVPGGVNQGVDVFVTNPSHVIIDVDGYFVPWTQSGSNSLAFYPIGPCRVADTRNATGSFGGPSITGGTVRTFPMEESNCNIPVTAQAYSLNVTAVPKGPLGFVTLFPTGQTQPLVSTLNATTGTATANAAIVPAGAAGAVSVYASDTTDVVLDVTGYFQPPGDGGLDLFPVTPCRVLDTRNGAGLFSSTQAIPVTKGPCAVPDAQAYVLNATVIPPAVLDYLTLWPDGSPQPYVSTLNAADGNVTSNMTIVPTNNGGIDAYASNPTQLAVDISGYFAPDPGYVAPLHVAFVGDSIAMGLVAQANNPLWTCDDCAPEATSGQVLAGLPAIIATHPDAIVIMTGSYDVDDPTWNYGDACGSSTSNPSTHLCDNIIAMTGLASAANIPVITGTTPAWEPGTLSNQLAASNPYGVQQGVDVTLFFYNRNLGEALYLTEEEEGITEANGSSFLDYWMALNTTTDISLDGINPSVAGYDVMLNLLIPAINALDPAYRSKRNVSGGNVR